MHGFYRFLAIAMVMAALSTPVLAGGDEMVELHSKVQTLAEQVSRLQRSLDENVGVMTDLINRNAETTRTMERNVEQLQHNLEQRNALKGGQFDKVGIQIDAMQTGLIDLEARLQAVTRSPVISISPQAHLAVTSPPTSLPPAIANSQPAASPPSPQPIPVQEPAAAMDLYRSAMRHYASKDFETAATEFTKFLKVDHQSESAANAQFYLAEIEFDEKDFEGALDDYTTVGPRLDQVKAARAQYKKALCLIEVDREDEAILELQALRTKYPHSVEATQAAKKLRALGVRGAVGP